MFGAPAASALPAAASSVIITSAQLSERGEDVDILKATEGLFGIVGASYRWCVELCKELSLK